MIAFDSHTTLPPSTSSGTFAFGFSDLNFGVRCSPFPTSTATNSTGEFRYLATAQAFRGFSLDELELVGSRASAGEMRRVMPFVANHKVRVGELITHHFALTNYQAALDTFNDRASGAIKIIVHP